MLNSSGDAAERMLDFAMAKDLKGLGDAEYVESFEPPCEFFQTDSNVMRRAEATWPHLWRAGAGGGGGNSQAQCSLQRVHALRNSG